MGHIPEVLQPSQSYAAEELQNRNWYRLRPHIKDRSRQQIDDNSEELDFLDLWIQLDYFHFLLFNIFSLSLCQLVIRLKVNVGSGAEPPENFRTSYNLKRKWIFLWNTISFTVKKILGVRENFLRFIKNLPTRKNKIRDRGESYSRNLGKCTV